jgi:hypothetical protein
MGKHSIKSDLTIVKVMEFFKPLPSIIWLAFVVVLIVAILITIDWFKTKNLFRKN